MNLHVIHEDGYVLARTSGPIDESTEEVFREQLHPLVAQRGTLLILDLSNSRRINSTGISRLVLLATDANTKNSRVILAAPSPFVDGVLRVSHLDRFFEISESVAAAIEK
jgi:anti-anti-sigma factor